MQVELQQNIFRFLLLSHINELMINKELIINTIRKATINLNVSKTPSEISDGATASTEPILKKEIKQILRDLNAFALSGGDEKRRGATDSTTAQEVSIDTDTADIKNNTFMLETSWGFLGKDLSGNSLSDELETAFNAYIKIVREISSWVLYLTSMREQTTVSMGASALSTLLGKWGPTSLYKDLDSFYVDLFEHVGTYSLQGEVLQLLETTPVGISIKVGYKNEVKFDGSGHTYIKLPMPVHGAGNSGERYYLTDVDYIDVADDCGKPDIELDVDYDKCADGVSLQLLSINGLPLCKQEKHSVQALGRVKSWDPPPTIGVYDPRPYVPQGEAETCCAPPILLLPLVGCTPQDDNNDAVLNGMKKGMTDYASNNMRLVEDMEVCSSAPINSGDCTITYTAWNHVVTARYSCTSSEVQEVKDTPSEMMGKLDCAFR
jgi:hypothetical protein